MTDDWFVGTARVQYTDACSAPPTGGWPVELVCFVKDPAPVHGGYKPNNVDHRDDVSGGTPAEPLGCGTQVWHWSFTDDTLDDTDQWEAVKGGVGGGLSGGWFVAGGLTSGGIGLTTPYPPLTSGTDYTIAALLRNDDDAAGAVQLQIKFTQNANGSGVISENSYGSVTSTDTVVVNLTVPANPGGGSTVSLRWGVHRPSAGQHTKLAVGDVLVATE